MIEGLITATLTLTALVETENERLATERPSELALLINEKSRHALEYEQLVRPFRQNPLLLRSGTPEQLSALRRAMESFDSVALRNGKLLLKLKSARENMLKAIATELNPHNRRPTLYTAGMPAPDRHSTSALAVNAVV